MPDDKPYAMPWDEFITSLLLLDIDNVTAKWADDRPQRIELGFETDDDFEKARVVLASRGIRRVFGVRRATSPIRLMHVDRIRFTGLPKMSSIACIWVVPPKNRGK